MADSTIKSIDRLFDIVDNTIGSVDRVLNRSKYTEEQLSQHAKKRPAVIDVVEEKPKAAKAKAPSKSISTSTALARKPHFYIVESITPAGTLFVVTDGGNARTECATREFAEKILSALRAAP